MKSEQRESHPTHFHWLDLLRFSAALCVVAGHARNSLFVEYGALAATQKTVVMAAAYALTRMGNEAVTVFFVLSGFLVGGRAFERMVHGSFKPRPYAIDRFVRIMLPLVPALAFTAAVCLTVDGRFSVADLLGNLLSLQGVLFPVFGGNGPLWSLSYEVWFYILVFAIGQIVLRRSFHIPSLALLVLVLGVFTVLESVHLFCWLIGALAYVRRPSRFSVTMLVSGILLGCHAVIGIQIAHDSVSVSVGPLVRYFLPLGASRIMLSTGIAILVQQLILLKPRGPALEKLDRIGTGLASFSYTLYLVHYPLLALMTHIGLRRADTVNAQSLAMFAAALAVCMLTGWLLYLPFERQTSGARRMLKRKLIRAPGR